MSTVTDDKMELWENVTAASAVLRKAGADGKLREERVDGHRRLHITPQDRRLNQEICADEKHDVFLNGTLVPVRLLNDEDAQEFANNPNVMTEAEMVTLVKGHAKSFAARLSDVSNVLLVKRWIEVAKENDAPFKRIEALEGRLAQLKPSASVHSTAGSADTSK